VALTRFLGVVSDMDGTLLRSDGTMSPATVEMLRTVRQRGVPFVVATARTPRAVQRIDGHQELDVVVCANGAIVWDAGADEVVSEVTFAPAALSAAIAGLRAAVPDVAVALHSARRMFVDERYVALRPKGLKGDWPYDSAGMDGEGIAIVAVRHPGLPAEELAAALSQAFAGLGTASFSSTTVADVVPAGVTKAATVAGFLGCPPAATVAFGDMPNDLPLFAWAGWSVAVANAHPAVLAAADEVVPDNDADGVARAVERLFRDAGR
jgi:Cof subfamily protein (haloacid dehalogenase superfamily)